MSPTAPFRRLTRAFLAPLLLGLLLGAALPAGAADKAQYPKFNSLRAAEVNLRVGPGEQYPVQWVYRRKGLPVEVIDGYDVWRKIRDWQGTTGWVHQRMLAPARTIIVKTDTRTIYREPARDSGSLARLEPGVVAKLLECRNAWCRIETQPQGIRGWLLRSEIWGVYPDEVVE